MDRRTPPRFRTRAPARQRVPAPAARSLGGIGIALGAVALLAAIAVGVRRRP